MVMEALVRGTRTSIASGSGLARTRLGALTAAGQTKKESSPLEFGNCLHGMAIVTATCFMNRTFCRTTGRATSHKFLRLKFLRIPLDHEECKNYTYDEGREL